MNDELKELISKADRGDGVAQQELMKRGAMPVIMSRQHTSTKWLLWHTG